MRRSDELDELNKTARERIKREIENRSITRRADASQFMQDLLYNLVLALHNRNKEYILSN